MQDTLRGTEPVARSDQGDETQLRFCVLGPLRVELGGEVVRITSGIQRGLLAVLLEAGHPVPRARVIDQLWGERPPEAVVAQLRVQVGRLRDRLGDVIRIDAGEYSLAGVHALDVHEVERLAERARADPESASELLRKALALYRGDPLEDVEAGEHVAHWKRILSEQRTQVLLARIDADLAQGAASDLVGELDALTRRHPFEERLWAQLMLSLYRAGRPAEALDAFERARRVFADELGLTPGEPLIRLQRQILEQDPALQLSERGDSSRPSTPSDRGRQAPPTSIPRATTRLIGRERELAELAGLAADPDARLITLTGTGGVGKTRLALELGAVQESLHRDGALFVRLERLQDASLVSAEIATALGVREGEPPVPHGALSQALAHRELLLILDNLEHLLDCGPTLADLLAAAPHLRILTTSRRPLGLRGEHVYEVQPLGLPSDHDEQSVAESPAVQLFIQSALTAHRALRLDPQTMRCAAAICAGLDGLPLAIELAAARVRTLTPEQIADQLSNPLILGERALRDLPDRQQSMSAAIRWSYNLLNDRERSALRAAGVFLGGFSADALGEVLDEDPRGELEALQAASLVIAPAPGRYRLLELVRAFALEELHATGELDEVTARHRRHFAAVALPAAEALDAGVAPGEIAAGLLDDLANLRAALESAIASADPASASAVALGLRPVWILQHLRTECHDIVDRVCAAGLLEPEQELALLRIAAYLETGELRFTDRLAARARDLGDDGALTVAVARLVSEAADRDDLEELTRQRGVMLELVRRLGPDSPHLPNLYHKLGLCDYIQGGLDDAVAWTEQALELAEARKIPFNVALTQIALVSCRTARDGRLSRADLLQTLERVRTATAKPMIVVAVWIAASYAAELEPELALRWLAEAEHIYVELAVPLKPEVAWRFGALARLDVRDPAALLTVAPPAAPEAMIAEACRWAATRRPDETVEIRPLTRQLRPGA